MSTPNKNFSATSQSQVTIATDDTKEQLQPISVASKADSSCFDSDSSIDNDSDDIGSANSGLTKVDFSPDTSDILFLHIFLFLTIFIIKLYEIT